MAIEAQGSEWKSHPRMTPMAGRRKATSHYCLECEVWHNTHRAVGGRTGDSECHPPFRTHSDFPHIRIKQAK